ncbi:hypothetical protein A2U01_0048083, partial [Trifolium medium]|nr:hypothetical protein [Trifolium medium]
VSAGTTPPSDGLIAVQRRFVGHFPLLITRDPMLSELGLCSV